MKWEKLDFTFNSDDCIEGYRGAAVPFAVVKEDVIRIYFTARNTKNQSNIFWLDFDMERMEILGISDGPVLSPGKLGCFDDSGVMMSWYGEVCGHNYLYYIGWNLGVTVPFRNSLGLAESADGSSFSRVFVGPVLDRTRTEPHFCASNWIVKEENFYRMYYLSCVEWIHLEDGTIAHKYHIKSAESTDGINWERDGHVCIDFKDEKEYAISRPCVIKSGENDYHMWFSARGEKYRIGYAHSTDGLTWNRYDEKAGITVSENGIDSEMICYPCVFKYKNDYYMLFNGNGYGMTGFGIAKLNGDFSNE